MTLKYTLMSLIQGIGIILEYSYKIHGYKQKNRLKIKSIGEKITDWADNKIRIYILKKYGEQGSQGGW